ELIDVDMRGIQRMTQKSRGCEAAFVSIGFFVAMTLGAARIAAAAEAPTPAGDAPELTEITVTGSRIVRRDLEASSPIVTVGDKAFTESSTIGIESVLNQLPQFVPGTT